MDRIGADETFVEDLGFARVLGRPLDRGHGLPVVHGWLRQGTRSGEFAMVARDGERWVATRDAAGTRALYVATSGKWIASDHRFFPNDAFSLVRPGSTYDFQARRARGRRSPKRTFEGTFTEAGRELASILDKAVEDRVTGISKVGVAFSGGLDSSLLVHCAKKRAKVFACSVHASSSLDSACAPKAAEALGVDLLEEVVTPEEVKRELRAIDLPFPPSRMDRSLWCIFSKASRLASEEGAKLVLLGQLADELFGGYMKYERAVEEEGERVAGRLMKEDMAACASKGFVRDEAACSRWIEPRFPFADERILELGRKLPVEFKIRGGVRKAVLREAARSLGLPAELVEAPKKAAQYSSGVQRILE
jgi:asparagine synthase (glutamine-hydrolysing)